MSETNLKKLLFFVAIALLSSVYIIDFWVIDDAYINIRILDNFFSKNGLVYNINERVEAFTSPLWLFYLSVFYFFIKTPFYAILMASSLSLIGFFFILYKYFKSDLTKAVFVLFAFLASKTFIDFSSSGFENSLSLLLGAAFLYYFKAPQNNYKKLFFIASLIALNRLDNLLYFTPALIYVLYLNRQNFSWLFLKQIIISLSPLIFWQIFSFLYYGFLFPNTAYAKLFNSPLGFIEKVELGLDYFFFTLKTDVFVFIFFSLITALAVKKKNYRNLSLVFGVFIYFLYVLFSAGSANHIGNRFFYLANVITVISFFDQNKNQIYGKIVMLLVFLYMAINPYSPIKITTSFYGNGKYNAFETKIKKALEFYYYDQAYKARILKTGSYLIPNISKDKVSDNKWYKQAVKLNETQGNLRLKGAIGFFGYATPLDVHIIDILGLADAFVARLANCDSIYLRPGHFLRKIPNGYFKTIASNKNFIKNKNLAKYFEKINLITSGDILSKKRIITIYKLNIGKYDYLLESSCDNLQSDFTKKFIKDTKHKK